MLCFIELFVKRILGTSLSLVHYWTVFGRCLFFCLQILEVNGQSMLQVSHSKALELLRKTTHLSITVKSNLAQFKEMLENSEKNATLRRQDSNQSNNKQRLSAPDLDNAMLHSPQEKKSSGKKEKGFMMTIASTKPKVRKALRNLIPRNMSSSSMNRYIIPFPI